MTTLKDREVKALTEAQGDRQVCVWRATRPLYKIGRVYSAGPAGQITVVSVARVQIIGGVNPKDVTRSGYTDWADFMAELREIEKVGVYSDPHEIWEARVLRGDRQDRPRLLQPAGRKSGDYTSMPGRAMGGVADPGEAPSAAEMERLAWLHKSDLDVAQRTFLERTIAEARTLFNGRDALRNFERVAESLAQEKPGEKKRRRSA